MLTPDELRAEYVSRLPVYRSLQAQVVEAISRALGREGIQIRSRIKAWEGVHEKLLRLGTEDLDAVRDIVGIRVVVPDGNVASRAVGILGRDLEPYAVSALAPRRVGGESTFHLSLTPTTGTYPSASVEIQILTRSAEALHNLKHELAYKVPGPRAVEELEAIIDEFEQLLDRPGVHEKRDIHRFIAKHRFLLHPNPDELVSEVPLGLGTEFRMDFLIRRADGTWRKLRILSIDSCNATVIFRGPSIMRCARSRTGKSGLSKACPLFSDTSPTWSHPRAW